MAPSVTSTVEFGGTPGRAYQVALRARGVVEAMSYVGAAGQGMCVEDVTLARGGGNWFALRISSPPHVYFFNNGPWGVHSLPLDCTVTLTIEGGARVVALAGSGDDQGLINQDASGKPIRVPGVSVTPDPFNGEFVEFEVLSVE